MTSPQNLTSGADNTITETTDTVATGADTAKPVIQPTVQADDDPEKGLEEFKPDPSAQAGVQKVQAITLSWTKTSLAFLLCL